MDSLPRAVDVAIVGAGTAGAAAALFCARAGLTTVCLDSEPLERAGARWVNGLARGIYDELGIDAPRSPELVGDSNRFHLVAGYDGPRLSVEPHALQDVDMRLFVRRLHGLARDAGAQLIGRIRVSSVSGSSLRTDRGEVRAQTIVDASGLGGLRLLRNPPVHRQHLCSAAQEVRGCDPEGARRYFERHRVEVGDTLCFTSVAGGFSLVNISAHGDQFAILAGTITAQGQPSGRALLEEFVSGHDWIGEKRFGGSRAIPLRRPYDRLASGRIATIGDAACQVFPAHGSGVGPGLQAAQLLADTLASGGSPDDYGVAFQRRYGGLLGSFDVFRRFAQTLTSADLARLMEVGLINPVTARAGMEQRLPPSPTASEIRDYAWTLAREPRLMSQLAAVLARMLAVQALYARYPRSATARPRWSRMVAALVGDRPDTRA